MQGCSGTIAALIRADRSTLVMQTLLLPTQQELCGENFIIRSSGGRFSFSHMELSALLKESLPHISPFKLQ